LRDRGVWPGYFCGGSRSRASTALSSSAVTFPEAVALAEILTGPAWHHYVAATPARQAGQFYRRVSARLGEGAYQAPSDDPVIAWASRHRSTPHPVPEIRHFK